MKAFKIKSISKDDTLILKAIGIILIVLHNYFRWVKPITGENEFGMSPDYISKSFQLTVNYPLEFLNVFFNFLGHYGVQIFIFISAYGLTKGYLNKSVKWQSFVRKRFVKLYPTLLLSAFAMIVFNIAAHGNLPSKGSLIDISTQLSLLSTLIPQKALVAVGPWWFYSMIFQFYLIFPVLLRIFEKYKGKGLLIITIAAYGLLIFVNPVLLNLKLNLLHTVFGHLPEFCLGIWIAGKKEFKISIWIYILAILLFMLSNYYKVAWYFSHLAVIIILLPILQYFVKKIKNNDFINKIVLFIGLISVYVFAVHGFLRWEFVGLANYLNHPIAEFISGIMFLVFSIGIAYLLFSTENQMRKWIGLSDNSKHRKYKIIMLIVLLAGLVLSVKACQGINYEKRKNKKESKTFTKDTLGNLWHKNNLSFKIDVGDTRPDSYAKFYIWNNSVHDIIIDDFSVELIYIE